MELNNLCVRVSDNVLDDEDWTVTQLRFSNVPYLRVVGHWDIHRGVYNSGDFTGWDIEKLLKWLNYDSTGDHPENYHEIYIDGMWLFGYEVDYNLIERVALLSLSNR